MMPSDMARAPAVGLRLNRTLLQQTDANSADLTLLAAVVHRPGRAGDYVGTVYRRDQAVGEFTLRVLETPAPLQIQIDLATQRLRGEPRRAGEHARDDCDCDEKSEAGARAVYTLGREGFAVFHVSTGAGGYAVQLAAAEDAERWSETRRDDRDRGRHWDSRELEEGDLFAVTLLRPGTYRVVNETSGAQADIRLAYPKRGREAYRPPEPMRIAVTQNGFKPERIELQPLQGQVYEIGAPSRLTISLVEPDDGPGPRDTPERGRRPRHTLTRRMPQARPTPEPPPG
jgi:hypothetical protein